MNKQQLEFLKEIIPLLSTIVGGGITYLATRGVEDRKLKLQMKRDTLDTILIPYGTCLEQIKGTEEIKESHLDVKFDIFEEYIKSLHTPLEYLNISKMIYLSKENIKLLEEYSKLLKNFNDGIEKKFDLFVDKYKKLVLDVLSGFEGFDFSYDDIVLKFEERAEIKFNMLRTNAMYKFNILYMVNSIKFIENKNCIHSEVKDINLLHYLDLYYPVDYLNIGYKNININTKSIEYKLTQYLYSNMENEKEKVDELLIHYSLTEQLDKILIQVEMMKNQVIKEINKIPII